MEPVTEIHGDRVYFNSELLDFKVKVKIFLFMISLYSTYAITLLH